jgi:hypothetical protein
VCGTGFALRVFTLSHSTSPIFVIFFFFEIGSCRLFALLALNCDPPDVCVSSSWDCTQ